MTIKEFRSYLGKKSFNDVCDFAQEFVSFVQDNVRFFPEDVRRKKFVDHCQSVALGIFFREEDGSDGDNEKFLEGLMSSTEEVIEFEGTPYTNDEATDLFAVCKDDLAEWFNSLLEVFGKSLSQDQKEEFVEYVFRKALFLHGVDDNYTGLVFAGFGDHSVFPELVSYGRCKFWGTKFVALEERVQKITHDFPATIEGFAQTSMVDTFTIGISFEAYAHLNKIIAEEVHLAFQGLEDGGVKLPGQEDKDALINERIESAKGKLAVYMRDNHDAPLRRVLGVLPVDEMAELAETLINLQSVKEKVTKPSESVGGPIDVAAITRSEGLVWIKRKHYFDGQINSRFFDRQR